MTNEKTSSPETHTQPIGYRNEEAGFFEFVNEDRPRIVCDIPAPCAILVDMETRKVIGYRVYDQPYRQNVRRFDLERFLSCGGNDAAMVDHPEGDWVKFEDFESHMKNMPSVAAKDVLAERLRQQEKEGWTPWHDDLHNDFSLTKAAIVYASCAATDGPDRAVLDQFGLVGVTHKLKKLWPTSWDISWLKPKDRRRDLIKAAALIVAEIERLDRAALATSGE